MKLKIATLIGIISLFNLFYGHLFDININKISDHNGSRQEIICSLLEIFKNKKRSERNKSSIEVSDSDLDSETESGNESNRKHKVSKKKKSKLRKSLERIPKFFRRIFKRKSSKAKTKGKNESRISDEKSLESEIPEKKITSSVKPKTVIEPVVTVEPEPRSRTGTGTGTGSGSESELESKASDNINSNQENLSSEAITSRIKHWKVPKTISEINPKDDENNHLMSELKDKLKPHSSNFEKLDTLLIESDPSGKKNIFGMTNQQFYNYLKHHVSLNTGGIELLLKLDEILSSTSIEKKLLDLEIIDENAEESIKNLFKQESKTFRENSSSLFSTFHQDVGEQCTFPLMDDLIKIYYNQFMEFKLAEEDYEFLLDPRISTPTERVKNMSKSYYEMKASKSKLRKTLIKYVNCHMITFFTFGIDNISIGQHEEKCNAQDLATLLYFKNIFQALNKLNYNTFKENEAEVAEYNNMLISGFESLSEDNKIKYKILDRLSKKLLSLHLNANLYRDLVLIIEKKLSLCLTYIVKNHETNKLLSTKL